MFYTAVSPVRGAFIYAEAPCSTRSTRRCWRSSTRDCLQVSSGDTSRSLTASVDCSGTGRRARRSSSVATLATLASGSLSSCEQLAHSRRTRSSTARSSSATTRVGSTSAHFRPSRHGAQHRGGVARERPRGPGGLRSAAAHVCPVDRRAVGGPSKRARATCSSATIRVCSSSIRRTRSSSPKPG